MYILNNAYLLLGLQCPLEKHIVKRKYIRRVLSHEIYDNDQIFFGNERKPPRCRTEGRLPPSNVERVGESYRLGS